MMIVGNKCDLPSENRVVSKGMGQSLAENYGIIFMETSAKCNTNVDEVHSYQLIMQVITYFIKYCSLVLSNLCSISMQFIG